MIRAPSPFTIASMTWSRRIRRPFGMIWVGRWRLPRCQATLTRCSGSAPRISTSGSAAATTSTSLPSSSTSASPPRNATAFSRSSRNSSPRVPVIAIRRRCRSSKSSTMVSAAACVQRCCPRTWVARIMAICSASRQNSSTLPSLMISITVGAVFICEEYSRHTFMCGALPWALRSSRVSQRSTTT